MRLDVSAKDQDGRELFKDQKRYFQIGVDTQKYMRYGAWQIKEFYDLALQPKEVQKERFLMNFGKETRSADVEVSVTYCLSGKKCDVIYTDKTTLSYQ
ncbi:MAG: hypothetical protein PVJ36_04095 [Nitrospirota bacterium]